ncbi:hypothetical protein GC175_28100 [bacterium]|nr:hypothetical protein [bacterium]
MNQDESPLAQGIQQRYIATPGAIPRRATEQITGRILRLSEDPLPLLSLLQRRWQAEIGDLWAGPSAEFQWLKRPVVAATSAESPPADVAMPPHAVQSASLPIVRPVPGPASVSIQKKGASPNAAQIDTAQIDTATASLVVPASNARAMDRHVGLPTTPTEGTGASVRLEQVQRAEMPTSALPQGKNNLLAPPVLETPELGRSILRRHLAGRVLHTPAEPRVDISAIRAAGEIARSVANVLSAAPETPIPVVQAIASQHAKNATAGEHKLHPTATALTSIAQSPVTVPGEDAPQNPPTTVQAHSDSATLQPKHMVVQAQKPTPTHALFGESASGQTSADRSAMPTMGSAQRTLPSSSTSADVPSVQANAVSIQPGEAQPVIVLQRAVQQVQRTPNKVSAGDAPQYPGQRSVASVVAPKGMPSPTADGALSLQIQTAASVPAAAAQSKGPALPQKTAAAKESPLVAATRAEPGAPQAVTAMALSSTPTVILGAPIVQRRAQWVTPLNGQPSVARLTRPAFFSEMGEEMTKRKDELATDAPTTLHQAKSAHHATEMVTLQAMSGAGNQTVQPSPIVQPRRQVASAPFATSTAAPPPGIRIFVQGDKERVQGQLQASGVPSQPPMTAQLVFAQRALSERTSAHPTVVKTAVKNRYTGTPAATKPKEHLHNAVTSLPTVRVQPWGQSPAANAETQSAASPQRSEPATAAMVYALRAQPDDVAQREQQPNEATSTLSPLKRWQHATDGHAFLMPTRRAPGHAHRLEQPCADMLQVGHLPWALQRSEEEPASIPVSTPLSIPGPASSQREAANAESTMNFPSALAGDVALDQLADAVYRLIEQRLRIERESMGL